MAKVFLTLTDDERQALINLAQQQKRYPRDQAALFVREGLERAGYLAPITAPAFESFANPFLASEFTKTTPSPLPGQRAFPSVVFPIVHHPDRC